MEYRYRLSNPLIFEKLESLNIFISKQKLDNRFGRVVSYYIQTSSGKLEIRVIHSGNKIIPNIGITYFKFVKYYKDERSGFISKEDWFDYFLSDSEVPNSYKERLCFNIDLFEE